MAGFLIKKRKKRHRQIYTEERLCEDIRGKRHVMRKAENKVMLTHDNEILGIASNTRN